jgi:hypothetical protein
MFGGCCGGFLVGFVLLRRLVDASRGGGSGRHLLTRLRLAGGGVWPG